MSDRNKVIEALEACVLKDPDDSRNCRHCPRCNYGAFITNSCINGVMADALALLKAQEPRVMTLEEVKQWCEIHPHKQTPIWVEFQHGHGTDGWRVGLVNSGLLAWCKDNEARCWTSCPDEKRRAETPWQQ